MVYIHTFSHINDIWDTGRNKMPINNESAQHWGNEALCCHQSCNYISKSQELLFNEHDAKRKWLVKSAVFPLITTTVTTNDIKLQWINSNYVSERSSTIVQNKNIPVKNAPTCFIWKILSVCFDENKKTKGCVRILYILTFSVCVFEGSAIKVQTGV